MPEMLETKTRVRFEFAFSVISVLFRIFPPLAGSRP
jgi:hypothetical protein